MGGEILCWCLISEGPRTSTFSAGIGFWPFTEQVSTAAIEGGRFQKKVSFVVHENNSLLRLIQFKLPPIGRHRI